MTVERQQRVLGLLLRRGDWITGAELAERLGVTGRSVRSYVTAINAVAPDAVASGPSGYRASTAATRALELLHDAERAAPRERMRSLIGMLLAEDAGLDVFEAARRLHVSDATAEGDLRRLRAALEGTELRLEREDGFVSLAGAERAKRRFLTRQVLDALGERAFDAEAMGREAAALGVPVPEPAGMRRRLVERLRGRGLDVDELSAAEIVLRIAVAVARSESGHALPDVGDDGGPAREGAGAVLDALAREFFGTGLGRADRRHLAGIVLVSLVDGGDDAKAPPRVERAVRRALARASGAYGLELGGEAFAAAFASHVQNVVRRARERIGSRNPMTRSVKLSSPLTFEVAVSVAGELSDELGVPIPDDEIAEMAMRIGSVAGDGAVEADALTAVLVCPGYAGLRRRLRAELGRALGHEVVITGVETGYEPDWERLGADLVLTTIDAPSALGDRAVRIQPFLGARDIARVAEAAQRIRQQRRMSGLRAEMRRWFAPGAFFRNPREEGREGVIRMLGEALVRDGAADEAYIASTLEREARSSTAFTDSLAVPHAMTMSATRTAIAVAVNERAIDWGDDRVNVVAMVAFAETDREAFQTVFEQFVEVFADPARAARIVRSGETLPAFLDEIAALIDAG